MPERLRTLLLDAHDSVANLSYYHDWHQALVAHPRLDVEPVGTLGKARLALELLARRWRDYDLVLFPYGYYYANQDAWSRVLAGVVAGMRGVKVFGRTNSGRRSPRRKRRGCAFSLGEYRYTRPSGAFGSGMPSVKLLPEPPVLYFSKFLKRMKLPRMAELALSFRRSFGPTFGESCGKPP